jgi:hypothetical protein
MYQMCLLALWSIGTVAMYAQITPLVTPALPPSVNGGGTLKFTSDRPVNWSCPHCRGSIDPDGTYHAPAIVTAKQQFGGCQILPNNHILNTRIDSVPVHSRSAAWLQTANTGAISFAATVLTNFADEDTPRQNMTFFYTPGNNGVFKIPSPPDVHMEGGWYASPFGQVDHHMSVLDPDACVSQEIYKLYSPGTNPDCSSCTSQSGLKFQLSGCTAAQRNCSDVYHLPSNGATDAASLYLMPLVLHLQELEMAIEAGGVAAGATIHHPLRTTLKNGMIQNAHIWPAMANASAGANDPNNVPYGAWFRLKSSFNIDGFCSSEAWCAAAKLILTEIRQYGMILADGSDVNWELDVDGGHQRPDIADAFKHLTGSVTPANIEAVDVSGLQTAPTSGDVAADAEEVVATASNGVSSVVHVALTGVAVGTRTNVLAIEAGGGPIQLIAWVNGSSNAALTWRASGPGTVNANGLYTPPTNVASPQLATIRAASVADPRVFVTIYINVFPDSHDDAIRVTSAAATGSSFTDSQGKVWWPMADLAISGHSWGHTYESGWPLNLSDLPLYSVIWNDVGDQFFTAYMRPGTYKISGKFATTDGAPGVNVMHLETQGHIIYRDVDLYTAAGDHTPIDYQLPAVVGPDGRLEFVIRKVDGNQGSFTKISSLAIEREDDPEPHITVDPVVAKPIPVLRTQQFRCVGWYVASTCSWSISPLIGSIDPNGLYRAPDTPLKQDTVVTITAISTVDPARKATASILVLHGIPPVRVNCAGSSFIDSNGNLWSADYGASGGYTYGEKNVIHDRGGTPLPEPMQSLYQKYRYSYVGDPPFTYHFDESNGTYAVTLKWAEFHSDTSTATTPRMDVQINGQTVLKNFDLVATAGRFTAYDQTFQISFTTHAIDITFISKGLAYIGAAINGIQIVASEPAK